MVRKAIISALIITTAIWWLGCGGQREGAEKTLVVGIVQTLPTLDPAMHRDRTVESVLRNIFDCLTTRDAQMNVVPQLAESWELVDDLTWKFKLRKGVKFHNGDELTAEDVVFTIERIIKPNMIAGRSSPRKGLIGPVVGAEAVDKYTVLIKTSRPWPILPVMLTFIEIVPKRYIQEKGDEYFAEHPVGTGPFKFVEWIKGERLVLERFEDYYGGSPARPPVGPAKIDRLIFKPIPEPASRIAALKAGECHIIQNLPPHLVEEVEADPRTKVLSCEGTRSFFLGMNWTKPPFENPKVREAVCRAVNVDLIIETIMKGMAIKLAGPLVPAAFGYNDQLKPIEYDPELARKLLKEAGYPEGFEVELDTDKDMKEIAEAIAADLSKVGIKAKVRVWEWGVLKPQLEKHERDLFLFSWGNASLDPVGILIPVFKTGGRGNYTGYSNPKVDQLLEKAETGMDPEKRKAYFREVQRILHEDKPVVFLFAPKEIWGVRASVRGWSPTPDGRMDMHDVYLASD
ncbi:ABC transporter substrate-binding protein [Candidatus Poribacteria bacterium]|nr:MAG: ABC transporter substrate-binding protein [Candidatus Poribacteria bacterium]